MGVDVKIEKVVKRYGDNEVVKGLSVDIKPGEFFTLLGPSGCGKTTLLRMIIGFNTIEEGTIKVSDQIVNRIPINKRNMGMVFQNYAIFPHMSVKQNVQYGLKNQKISKDEMERRVDDILEVVKITSLKDRLPEQLSGGQQQRVALARAIVTHPQVLLMDEPLSNLDAKLRVEMRLAIKDIQKKVDITTVYVTHDQEEALAVSDRIAVMNEGVIQQIGAPKEIYTRPINAFVSNFIGTTNFFKGERNGSLIQVDDYHFEMPNLNSSEETDVMISVRPHEFVITQETSGIRGVINSSVFLGLNTHYYVGLSDGREIEVIEDIESQDIIPEGTHVTLRFKEKRINIFNISNERSIIEGVDRDEAL